MFNTAFPESPRSATLVSVLSPVLLTNANGPCSAALPPVVTCPVDESPELQLTRPINAIPNIAVVAPVITLVRFLFAFIWPSFLFVCTGYLMGSRLCYMADDMAEKLERGGPRLVTPPLSTVVSDVALRCPERNPIETIDGRHDRPENDWVSMPSQCHAQVPWV